MKHHCHWTGCTRAVPPAMWGCREHWFRLPKPLRDAIWKEYVPGQEITKTPSDRYLAVAALVQGWIAGKVTVNKDGSIIVHEDLPLDAKEGAKPCQHRYGLPLNVQANRTCMLCGLTENDIFHAEREGA